MKNIIAMPDRRQQLWWLIILAAGTMIIPYVIQGTLASGERPDAIPWWVWVADHWAWGIRAIVEGLVIGYLARTHTETRQQAALLWVMKIALVTLITLTLGPAMYATSNGVTMAEALTPTLQWLWALGLASYMPLMVLASSYAYKVQPFDDTRPALAQSKAQPVTAKPVTPAKPKRQHKRKSGVNKAAVADALGAGQTTREVSEAFGISASRVRQIRAEVGPVNGKGE